MAVGFAFAAAATAQAGVPDYGYQWATITHPGNRAASPMEAPFLLEYPAPGAVAYEFRIATTEVTAGQWYEFVQAYAPYYQGSPADSSFTGVSIVPDSSEPSGYRLLAGHENRPTSMSWRFAARYVNWLCNGKATHREAFERDAYDTSTFSQNPDGSYNDQRTHTPGATFWIPTLDEWTKAVYFDPNRYGPGREGY